MSARSFRASGSRSRARARAKTHNARAARGRKPLARTHAPHALHADQRRPAPPHPHINTHNTAQHQQPLSEKPKYHASAPAAAAAKAAALAPAPATTASFRGPPLHAASPAGAPGAMAQKLAEVGPNAIAADSAYNFLGAAGQAPHPEFTHLKRAVDRLGLAGALGPDFAGTLLAPTDAAFDKFAASSGKTAGEVLADPEPSVLAAIVKGHLLTQAKGLSNLAPGEVIPTLGEASVRVDAADPVKIAVLGGPGDDTAVAERGVLVANGKAHIISINRVLVPPSAAGA